MDSPSLSPVKGSQGKELGTVPHSWTLRGAGKESSTRTQADSVSSVTAAIMWKVSSFLSQLIKINKAKQHTLVKIYKYS